MIETHHDPDNAWSDAISTTEFVTAAVSIAASASVADDINDGTTAIAPSQNAVFDALALKAPIDAPNFTGTVVGVTKAMVGLILDPSHIAGRRAIIFDLCQTALDLNFDGLMIETHHDPDNAWSDAKQPRSLLQLRYLAASASVADDINDGTTAIAPSQNAVFDALALKAPIDAPNFTGTVVGVTKAMVGLILDPSHIAGRRAIIFDLCQTALDLNFDGLMIETHHDPDNAWSDAKQPRSLLQLRYL